MTGREDPPEEMASGAGDDEFRPVVFDDSFIEAARLEESSAQERMTGRARPVRRRAADPVQGALPRQGVVLLMLITLAFGTAIFLGMRHPYRVPQSRPAEPLRITLLPLAPLAEVPGGRPADLFAHSRAASFRTGAEGVPLPPVRGTEDFTQQQVLAALATAKQYVVRSSLDSRVLLGGAVRQLRTLLDPAQHRQFDRSLHRPAADGRHAATGWLVRFDPARVALADQRVRVKGTLRAVQMNADTLEITADHVFVYAVHRRGTPAGPEQATLFTVRRQLRMRSDREDLRHQRIELREAVVRAGPLDCAAPSARAFAPLPAGERARTGGGSTGMDPYADGRAAVPLCGTLAAAAMPTPPATRGPDR